MSLSPDHKIPLPFFGTGRAYHPSCWRRPIFHQPMNRRGLPRDDRLRSSGRQIWPSKMSRARRMQLVWPGSDSTIRSALNPGLLTQARESHVWRWISRLDITVHQEFRRNGAQTPLPMHFPSGMSRSLACAYRRLFDDARVDRGTPEHWNCQPHRTSSAVPECLSD